MKLLSLVTLLLIHLVTPVMAQDSASDAVVPEETIVESPASSENEVETPVEETSEENALDADIEALKKELTEMRESMRDGSYQFGRNDLPLMRIVKKHTEKDLPCIRLFYLINQTHRQGLDTSDS